MPVIISLPYDHGYAEVLTDSCIVITSDGMFGDAVTYMKEQTMECMTPHEFRAVNWHRIISVRYEDINGCPRIIVRVSIYGMDLSERATGVMRVILRKLEPRALNNARISRRFFQARISWLAYFEDFKERRTAVAMANHRRLGNESAMNKIGNDVLAVVARFM